MNINNSNVLGLRNGILTKSNSDNNNFYINFSFDRRYNTNLSYNTDLYYNPFTQTLTCPNISGLIDKVEINNSDYNGNLKLTFSDGSNNLLDNAGLLYHPFFRILKVESNNSQTYQLLLSNTSQSAGIQIKGQPAMTQYEANITHYLDVLKIQNTGSDTEIQQVGSGTIYIYNDNGSLTLNGSGNIVASGIYAGNGSLLTNLDSDTIEITDTGDNIDYYLVFTNSAGSGKTLRVNETSSPGDTFTYNPSTNKLSVLRVYCGFIEADNYINVKTSELNGLIENLQLRNSIITIGTTGINLGNTKTEIVGLTKLAIGTSSPTTILDVRSTDSYTQGLFQNNNATNPGHIIIRNESYNEQIQIRSRYDGEDNHIFTWNGSALANLRLNGSIMLLGTGNVGIGITSPVVKLDVYGSIVSRGTPADINKGIRLKGRNEDGASYTTYNGGLQSWQGIGFECTHDSTTRHMFNTRNGDFIMTGSLGIGVTNPSHKLDVDGKVFSNNGFYTPTYTSGGNYYFGAEYLSRILAGMEIEHTTPGNFSQKLHFRTHHFNVSEDRRMTIDEDGNVGIGITNPLSRLSVNNQITGTSGFGVNNATSFLGCGNSANSYYFGAYIGADTATGASYIQSGFLDYRPATPTNTANYNLVLQPTTGNVGIGITPDPAYKLEVLGQLKCGNSANTLTALDIEINSSFAYGMYIGGWSSGGLTAGNSTIEMSSNLHIDSPSSGSIGPGNIYLNYYNSGQATFIRNRVDISDKRIKKDIVEIETEEQFNETFEIIKKVGSYKYKYRDIYRENDLDQYGFIAQEVLENYPVASKLAGDNCYLPNIMETLNFTYEVGDDNEYTFNIEGYDLDVNIKYIFYAFREGVEQFNYLENIEPTTNNTFTYTPSIIKNEEPPTYIKLVLVGTYTDDKLGVSKDKLFQLGFAGVRGLIDENEKMKNENETLKNRIDILEENQKKMIQKLNELIYGDNCWFKNSI